MNKVFKNVVVACLLAGLLLASAGPAVAAPAAAPATTYRPAGVTYTNQPTYTWSLVAGTAKYKLQVATATGALVVNVAVKSSACNVVSGYCSNTPVTLLSYNATYKWRVSAGTNGTSAWKSFNTKSGFNEQFASLTNWVVRPGGPWLVSGGTVHTVGVANKWSSLAYNNTFGNFTLSARMKRVSTTGGASGFWVRGISKFDTTYNAIKNGYLFLYSQNGCFSVWKHVNDTFIAVQDWTLTPSIVVNNWNVLKVTADGSTLRFSINNSLVWSGTDTSFKSGQVALTMFRSSSEKLTVDWAKLGMSDLFKAAEPGFDTVDQGQVQIAPDPAQPHGPEQAPAIP